MLTGPLQMFFDMFTIFGVLVFIIFIIVIVAAVASASKRSKVQRPMSEATSFPPPPPPDTVMVKCQYCGTEQTWSETCVKCGAPMPKPTMP